MSLVIHPDPSKSGSSFTTDNWYGKTEVQTFIAGGSITAGQWVSLDLSQSPGEVFNTVVAADSDAASTSNATVVGVALDAGSAGAGIRVIVAGYAAVANIADAATAGVALGISSTAGRAAGFAVQADTAAWPGPAFGVSLGTPSSNVGSAWVFRKV